MEISLERCRWNYKIWRKDNELFPNMTLEEKLNLLATDGMLVKRPILVGENQVLVGFKEKEWEALK